MKILEDGNVAEAFVNSGVVFSNSVLLPGETFTVRVKQAELDNWVRTYNIIIIFKVKTPRSKHCSC